MIRKSKYQISALLCYDSNVINILLQTYYGSDFLFVPIKLIPIFSNKENVLLLFERGECRIAFICSNSDKRYWRLIVFFAKSMKYIMMPFAKIFYHRPFWRIICLPNFWQSLHNKQHGKEHAPIPFLAFPWISKWNV